MDLASSYIFGCSFAKADPSSQRHDSLPILPSRSHKAWRASIWALSSTCLVDDCLCGNLHHLDDKERKLIEPDLSSEQSGLLLCLPYRPPYLSPNYASMKNQLAKVCLFIYF